MAAKNEMNNAMENRPAQDMEEGPKDTEEGERDDRAEPKALSRNDSTARSAVKLGHLRVGEDGQTMYKKTPSSAIMAAIQLGIGYSVGRLAAKPERDVLMVDFSFVEKVWFPGSGSRETPSHRFSDFRFKSYAPVAFRYFRDLFGIQPSDFLMSLSYEDVREVGNPGASGSLFFLSKDDMFIVKTVQHKEAIFLQQLLPGYYMNLHQNPRTSLPKFFGLYCYQSGSTNIRLIVMNNLLPSRFKCHQKYDLKGSTFKRRASKAELAKKSPTRKDLDFLNDHPEGILLEAETYDAVMKTIMRDCRVLESFKIMDYSLLLGIHNLDQAAKDKAMNSPYPSSDGLNDNPERVARRDEFSAALEPIQIDREEGRPVGGVPGKNAKGERLILFIGVIDILQSYRLGKKLEHGWKSMLHDGDTVSVHKPSFYAKRFLDFMGNKVFKRMPSVARGPSKRRTGGRPGNTPYRGKSSSTDPPVSRLGDDMIPPPYLTESVPPTGEISSSAPASSYKTERQGEVTTKTVKFSLDEEASEGKVEKVEEIVLKEINTKLDKPLEQEAASEIPTIVVENETVTATETVNELPAPETAEAPTASATETVNELPTPETGEVVLPTSSTEVKDIESTDISTNLPTSSVTVTPPCNEVSELNNVETTVHADENVVGTYKVITTTVEEVVVVNSDGKEEVIHSSTTTDETPIKENERESSATVQYIVTAGSTTNEISEASADEPDSSSSKL